MGTSRGLFRGRKGPLGRILGATWGLLGASWGPPGASLGPKKALGGLLKDPKTIVFTRFLAFSGFGQFCFKNYSFEGAGERSGGFWGRLGGSWGRFWAPKGPLGTLLGASWGVLGASWGPLGRLLGPLLGPKKRLGGLLAPIFGAASFFALFLRPEEPNTM